MLNVSKEMCVFSTTLGLKVKCFDKKNTTTKNAKHKLFIKHSKVFDKIILFLITFWKKNAAAAFFPKILRYL